jgi:hypothetical protein
LIRAQKCLQKKETLLREVKAFEDGVGQHLQTGASAIESRSTAATEAKLKELADAQARAARCIRVLPRSHRHRRCMGLLLADACCNRSCFPP